MRSSWEIGDGLLAWVRAFVPQGSSCLELGSGRGSALLAEHLRLVSVEHDPKWADVTARLGVPVVFAPIVDGWYAAEPVRRLIAALRPELVIVDGPPGHIGRGGFAGMVGALIASGVKAVVFDDTNRPAERELAVDCALEAQLGELIVHRDGDKAFTVMPMAGGFLLKGWDDRGPGGEPVSQILF